MKSSTLFTYLSVATAMVSAVSAQTNVYITGSTAFRANAHAAIRAKMVAGYTMAFTGSDINTAAQAVFKGTIGTDAVDVYTSWTGSVAGIKALAVTAPALVAGVRPKFLPSTQTTTVSPGTSGATTGTVSQTADIAFADNQQSSTPFRVSAGYAALNETKVGVIPFKFVSSYSVGGFPNPITNMTPRLASLLYSSGSLPAALWTGNVADQTTFIYATGRDPDSGTRIITLAETGYGSLIGVNHYKPVYSGSTVASHDLFPEVLLNTTTGAALPAGWAVGNGGQGGTAVADSLRYTTSAITGFYVAGLGILDANRALTGAGSSTPVGTGNAKELTWNGVPYSFTNVVEGAYTFWGYQYLDVRSSLGATTVQKKTANAISDYLINLPATPLANQATADALSLADMHVIRTGDGGDVGNDY
jgi:hypothetical protein